MDRQDLLRGTIITSIICAGVTFVSSMLDSAYDERTRNIDLILKNAQKELVEEKALLTPSIASIKDMEMKKDLVVEILTEKSVLCDHSIDKGLEAHINENKEQWTVYFVEKALIARKKAQLLMNKAQREHKEGVFFNISQKNNADTTKYLSKIASSSDYLTVQSIIDSLEDQKNIQETIFSRTQGLLNNQSLVKTTTDKWVASEKMIAEKKEYLKNRSENGWSIVTKLAALSALLGASGVLGSVIRVPSFLRLSSRQKD